MMPEKKCPICTDPECEGNPWSKLLDHDPNATRPWYAVAEEEAIRREKEAAWDNGHHSAAQYAKVLERALEMACGINVSPRTVKRLASISPKVRKPGGGWTIALNPYLSIEVFRLEAQREMAKEGRNA